jgi:hypothetical protein
LLLRCNIPILIPRLETLKLLTPLDYLLRPHLIRLFIHHMHTPWLLVAHHIEYFDTQEIIDKFLFKRKRRLKRKKERIRNRIRNRKKEKGNLFPPPRLGRFRPNPPLSPARSSPCPKPSTAQLPRPHSRHTTISLAPLVSAPSPSRPPSL